jgi:hypothetical protein
MCVSSVEILNYLKRNIGIIIKRLEETGVLVDIESIPNPPNLDVALSTRASESTLSALAERSFRVPYYWWEGFLFSEAWEWVTSTDITERKRRFYRDYHGRMGSFWTSESTVLHSDYWSEPVIVAGANTIESSPFNNAIHVRNSKDGSTVDQFYMGVNRAFIRPVLRVDACIPNPATLPSDAFLGFGFEPSRSLYTSIAILQVMSGSCKLVWTYMTPDGPKIISSASNITLNWGSWNRYILALFNNRLMLFEGTATAPPTWTLKDMLVADEQYVHNVPHIPIFFNEGANNIASGFYIGNFIVYSLSDGKVARKVIDVSSIAAGGYADSGVLALPKECAVSAIVTYGSGATAGVRVYILAANDQGATMIDSENTTDAFTYFDPSFAAGATRQRTVNLDSLPKYCRIRVRNLDGSVATGAVKVYVHEVW